MKLFSAFNPSLREQWAALTAPGEQFGVQCLAQGHFGLESVGDGNRTADSRIIGRLLNQLSYTSTTINFMCSINMGGASNDGVWGLLEKVMFAFNILP